MQLNTTAAARTANTDSAVLLVVAGVAAHVVAIVFAVQEIAAIGTTALIVKSHLNFQVLKLDADVHIVVIYTVTRNAGNNINRGSGGKLLPLIIVNKIFVYLIYGNKKPTINI